MKCVRCGINEKLGGQPWCEDCLCAREREYTIRPADPTRDTPAFPTQNTSPGYASMTLRDWFAGHALAGLLARGDIACCLYEGDDVDEWDDTGECDGCDDDDVIDPAEYCRCGEPALADGQCPMCAELDPPRWGPPTQEPTP